MRKDWFDWDGIRKSPAQFRSEKSWKTCCWYAYFRADDASIAAARSRLYLTAAGLPALTSSSGRVWSGAIVLPKGNARRNSPEPFLKRLKFYPSLKRHHFNRTKKAETANLDNVSRGMLTELSTPQLQNVTWNHREMLEEGAERFVCAHDTKFGKLAGRCAQHSPGGGNSASSFRYDAGSLARYEKPCPA